MTPEQVEKLINILESIDDNLSEMRGALESIAQAIEELDMGE